MSVDSRTGARVSKFPGGVPRQPNQWPFQVERPLSPVEAIRLDFAD